MKTKRFLIVITFLFSSITVFSQNTPFKEWLNDGVISSTYISKMMLDMAPDMKIGSVSIKEFDDVLEQVEIYTNVKSQNVIRMGTYMLRTAVGIAVENDYELVMQLNENKIQSVFYAKYSEKNKNIILDLIMITCEEDTKYYGKCIVIRMVGEFTLDDIRNITRPK